MERDRYSGGLAAILTGFARHQRTFHSSVLRSLEAVPVTLPSIDPPQAAFGAGPQGQQPAGFSGYSGGGSGTSTSAYGGVAGVRSPVGGTPGQVPDGGGTTGSSTTSGYGGYGSGGGGGKAVSPIAGTTGSGAVSSSSTQSGRALPGLGTIGQSQLSPSRLPVQGQGSTAGSQGQQQGGVNLGPSIGQDGLGVPIAYPVSGPATAMVGNVGSVSAAGQQQGSGGAGTGMAGANAMPRGWAVQQQQQAAAPASSAAESTPGPERTLSEVSNTSTGYGSASVRSLAANFETMRMQQQRQAAQGQTGQLGTGGSPGQAQGQPRPGGPGQGYPPLPPRTGSGSRLV